jgi:hypothetical protein
MRRKFFGDKNVTTRTTTINSINLTASRNFSAPNVGEGRITAQLFFIKIAYPTFTGILL